MKTNIFNITALALLLSTSFIMGKRTVDKEIISLPGEMITETIEVKSGSYEMVNAKIINGEVLPVVELPELIVSDSYNSQTMRKATLLDGEVIAVVELPELNVYSE